MKLDEYIIDWDKGKNIWLKKNRQISFEAIELKILNNDIIKIIPHSSKKYAHQFMIIVNVNNYGYVVPFVINKENNLIFLKTIFPSRKYTKKYLK